MFVWVCARVLVLSCVGVCVVVLVLCGGGEGLIESGLEREGAHSGGASSCFAECVGWVPVMVVGVMWESKGV